MAEIKALRSYSFGEWVSKRALVFRSKYLEILVLVAS